MPRPPQSCPQYLSPAVGAPLVFSTYLRYPWGCCSQCDVDLCDWVRCLPSRVALSTLSGLVLPVDSRHSSIYLVGSPPAGGIAANSGGVVFRVAASRRLSSGPRWPWGNNNNNMVFPAPGCTSRAPGTSGTPGAPRNPQSPGDSGGVLGCPPSSPGRAPGEGFQGGGVPRARRPAGPVGGLSCHVGVSGFPEAGQS